MQTGLNESIPILFGILFIAVIVWFILCNRLFVILKTRHPDTYESLGKPGLFKNSSTSNNLALIKFLFTRGWQKSGDRQLAILGRIMLVLFLAYLTGFAFLVAMILTESAR